MLLVFISQVQSPFLYGYTGQATENSDSSFISASFKFLKTGIVSSSPAFEKARAKFTTTDNENDSDEEDSQTPSKKKSYVGKFYSSSLITGATRYHCYFSEENLRNYTKIFPLSSARKYILFRVIRL